MELPRWDDIWFQGDRAIWSIEPSLWNKPLIKGEAFQWDVAPWWDDIILLITWD